MKMSKTQYALVNNLNPDDFKDSKDISKFLNKRDKERKNWAGVLTESYREYLKVCREWNLNK